MKGEKEKVNNVSKPHMKQPQTVCGQRHRSLFITNCSLLIVLSLLSLFIVSCDLFTDTKVDIYKAVSGEVDWANSPKLNVRIDYPSAWGTSVPVQGDITPARDLRKGYEFSVDFTPGSMYTLISWQAYLASDLQAVSGQPGHNWLENPLLIDEEDIESLGPNDVKLPTVTADNARGGTYKFTIYTTEPVTIVPWCDPQLRITRTEPRDISRSILPVSRASDIIIYFNGALNESTVKFADTEDDDGIWITATKGDDVTKNKVLKWFTTLEYAATGGFFTVTMNSGAVLPPEESLMTVTVKGVTGEQGAQMDEVYSFSWNTASTSEVELNSYNASYNYDDDEITVTYDSEGASVKMFYRLNGGAREEFFETIVDVPVLSDKDVRNGGNVSNIAEYEIFIELYADGIMEERTSFKIWNFPGMIVSDTNPAYEVIDAESALDTANLTVGLKNLVLNNANKQYVLANDITVSSTWTPIGSENTPFKGKLYGNGRTITFNTGTSIGGTTHRGLFGYTNGALIRDLTFEYNVTTAVSASAESCIGGVAGYLKDTTVRNVITSGGTLTVSAAAGTGAVGLGGIAGYVENSFISNCLAGMNVKLTSTGTGACNVGAVAGYAKGGSGGSITINIAAPGKAKDNKTVLKLAIDGVTVTAGVSGTTKGDALNIGGAAGGSLGNTMRDIVVSGQVSFGRTYITNGTRVGGVTGYAEDSNMENCSYSNLEEKAINGTIDNLNKIFIQIGGLIGYYIGKNGEVYINNCLVRGNIKIDEDNYGDKKFGNGIDIGGVLGESEYDGGNVNITNSFFEDGNITATCSSGSIQAGGFCGTFYEAGELEDQTEGSHYLNNCGVMAGTININVKNYGRYITVGGFTSTIWLRGNTSNCFSRANVISSGSGDCTEEAANIADKGDDPYTYTNQAGGFAGGLAPGSTLTSCYATGTVQSTHNGNRDFSAGGLVGSSGGVINNCYALGNVSANKVAGNSDTYNANAGGLVGATYKEDSLDSKIQFSFSAGQVIAQSYESNAYAGGVVGNLYKSDISNTAALGKSITAMSGSSYVTYTGRIYKAWEYGNVANNYALSSMTVQEGAYNSLTPAPATLDTGLDAKDGEDAASSTFLSQTFWSGSSTLGFSNDYWNFSRVAVEGYPRLAWEFQK